MTIEVRQYRYFYGSGSEPNREIRFMRDENGLIKASVHALIPAGFREISTLSDDKMSVEMMTTSERMRAFASEQENKPSALLSNLPKETQENIIRNLQPRGTWKFTISNDISDIDPRFEKIVNLNFFNQI